MYASFAVVPQMAKIVASMCYKCLIKMEKALSLRKYVWENLSHIGFGIFQFQAPTGELRIPQGCVYYSIPSCLLSTYLLASQIFCIF